MMTKTFSTGRAPEQAMWRSLLLRGGRMGKYKGVVGGIAPHSVEGVLSIVVPGLAAGLMVAQPALASDVVINQPPSNAPVVVQSPDVDNVTITSTDLITNGADAGNAPVQIVTDANSDAITVDVHDVTATAGDNAGIFIQTAGTGDVTVTSDGAVTGTARGINITNTGAGNISLTSTGAITGAIGGVRIVGSSQPGFNVDVHVNQVTVTTSNNTGAALDVNNTSDGGATTLTADGTLTNAGGHGIRINGVDGGSAGALGGPLTINVKDVVTGSRPDPSDVFTSDGGDGIQLVGAVGAAGAEQPINITTGNLDVTGTGVNLGRDINRVDGVTTVTTGNITAGAMGVVIESNDNDDNYAISVKTGNVTTGGTGIDVNQSGTGSISVETGNIDAGMVNAGGVNGFQDDGGYGVRLDSDPHGTTVAGEGGADWSLKAGDITVTDRSTGNFVGTGIGLGTSNNGGNGNTTVTAGNIQAGTGVVYNRNGTGTVSITTGDINATTGNGIQYGTNIVKNDLVINTGDITAAGKGITGDTYGSTDYASVTTINVGSITSGGDGIDVIHSGAGAATINSTGTIQSDGVGINLTNDSVAFFPPAPESQTVITVNNIDTPNNLGINVNSNAVKGTTITTTGAINTPAQNSSRGDGMQVVERNGPLLVNIAQSSTITSFNNAMELTNDGTAGTTVNVDGKLQSTALGGGFDGVIWVWGTPGTTTVNINNGSTVQAADRSGFVMTDSNGDSVVNVGNATVTGGFRLGAGDDALTFNGTDMANVGTLNGGGGSTGGDVLTLNAVQNFTRNLQAAGQEVQNWDAVNLNGGTADLVGTMTTDTFTLGKDGAGNPAALSIGANNVGDTLAVTGDYVGAGGNITIDADASTHTADTLVVGGDVSGVTGLSVNDMTASGAVSDLMDIGVVEVNGASSPGDAFVLADGPAVLGGRAYQLQQGDSASANPQDWFLVLQPCPPGGLNETNGATLGCQTDDTLTVNGTEATPGNLEGAGGMDVITVADGASVAGIVAGGNVGADSSAPLDGADRIVINTTGSVGGVQGNLGDDLIYVAGGSTVTGNVEGNEGSNQIRIGGLQALPDGSTPATDTVTVNGDVLGGDGTATDGNNQIWILGGAHVVGKVAGGNGNDTIVLNGATAAIDGGIEGGEGNDTIALMQGSVASVAGGAGDDNIALSGAAVDGAIDAGEGNNIVTLNAGSAGAVSAGAGSDSITLAGATIDGAINAGDGDNIVALNAGSASSVSAGAGADSITLAGATIGGAIDSGAGNDTVNLTSGTVAGGVTVGAGADTLNVAGATFTLGNTKLDGGAAGEGNVLNLNQVNETLITPQSNLVNWDTVNANNSTLTVSGGDSLTAAQVNLTNSMIVAHDGFAINGDLSLNASAIDLQNGATGGTFNVSGDYGAVGAGSVLTIDADFADNVADTLLVGGSITGVTQLNVTDVTPATAEATGEDVLVAKAGGSADVSNFALAGGPIVSGIWDYGLANGTEADTVVLRGSLNSLGAVYSGAAGVLADAFGDLPTMEQRIGQQRWLAKGNGGAFQGLWLRMTVDKTQRTPASSTVDFSTRSSAWGGQVGADFALVNNEGGLLTAGITGQFKDMDASTSMPGRTDKGKIRASGGGVGASITWNGAHGEYVDVQGQYNWLSARLGTTSFGDTVKGLGAESKSASLEVGKRFVLGNKSMVVPQVQVRWNQLSSDTFTDSKGVTVDLGNYESSLARVGLAYEYHPNGTNLTAPEKDGQKFYAIVNVVQNLSPKHTSFAQGKELFTRDQRTWGEFGLGGSFAAGGNALVYGQATYSRSFKNGGDNQDIGATVGLRIAF
jgi:outer membrane autotransporter protein